MNRKYVARYGNFPFASTQTVVYFSFFFFVIAGIIFTGEYKKFFGVIAFSLVLFMIYITYNPFFEKFRIENNIIYTKKFRHCKEIKIPDDALFVISYKSVGSYYNFSDEFMINIVFDSFENIVKELHVDEFACVRVAQKRALRSPIYDNMYIKSHLKNKYIYSFAYENTFANEFFSNQKKTVIIPESIEYRINVISNGFNIVVDKDR